VGGPGHRQPFGRRPLFGDIRLGETQPVRELAPHRLLLLQRSIEAFDWIKLTLEKSHGKYLSRESQSVCRISWQIQCV
jgi:hypothetical protein